MKAFWCSFFIFFVAIWLVGAVLDVSGQEKTVESNQGVMELLVEVQKNMEKALRETGRYKNVSVKVDLDDGTITYFITVGDKLNKEAVAFAIGNFVGVVSGASDESLFQLGRAYLKMSTTTDQTIRAWIWIKDCIFVTSMIELGNDSGAVDYIFEHLHIMSVY